MPLNDYPRFLEPRPNGLGKGEKTRYVTRMALCRACDTRDSHECRAKFAFSRARGGNGHRVSPSSPRVSSYPEALVNYSPVCASISPLLRGFAFGLITIRKIAGGKRERHTDLMEPRKLRFDSHAKFMR